MNVKNIHYVWRTRFEYSASIANKHNPWIGSRFSITQIHTGHNKHYNHKHLIIFHSDYVYHDLFSPHLQRTTKQKNEIRIWILWNRNLQLQTVNVVQVQVQSKESDLLSINLRFIYKNILKWLIAFCYCYRMEVQTDLSNIGVGGEMMI